MEIMTITDSEVGMNRKEDPGSAINISDIIKKVP